MEQAQTAKPRLARLADRIASWFVGAILLVTTATALVWSHLAPDQALWISLSVLVISCPCALALATPAALTSAASALRSTGVIVRGENALESLARTTHLIFDKTGTLTEGSLAITDVRLLAELPRERVLALAAAMQQYSGHPWPGRSAPSTPQRAWTRSSIRWARDWRGARAGDHTYRLGSESFCRGQALALPPPPAEPLYWVALVRDELPLAWIGLADRTRTRPRPSSARPRRRAPG